MSGSGPSVSARQEEEQPVEGVRNPEDGRCRAVEARVIRTPPLMSLKGPEPYEGRTGPAGPVRALEPEPCEGGEACGSRRAVFGPCGRPSCGRPRGREDDEEGAANR